MKKGMLVSVFRNTQFGDCSLNGMSARFTSFVLIGEGVPELFEADENHPALYLRTRSTGYLYTIPVDKDNSEAAGYCFGGNFVYSSDARFPNRYPIPVHDRKEF